jgi:hypothetical protein
MKFKKVGEIWKELDQMKRMLLTGTFSDHPFRSLWKKEKDKKC